VITASGGLNYVWSQGGTGNSIKVGPTSSALYSVTANNAQGCFASAQQIIIVKPRPTLIISASDLAVCAGSSSTLTVSGANTYTWLASSNTNTIEVVNPPATTVYGISGTNTLNCTSTETVMIGVFDPTVAITGNTMICSGETSTLIATGADTYTWSSGSFGQAANVTPNTTSVYTLNTISSSQQYGINCPLITTVEVHVNPTPTVNATSTPSSICRSESVTIVATGANTYSWSVGGSTATLVLTPTVITTLIFTVTGTDTQSCSSTAVVQVKVNSCNGISEAVANPEFAVYPNPNNGDFTVRFNSAMYLNVVNELGQQVKTISLDETNNFSSTVKGLASGIYFVSGEKDGQRLTRKIVVTK
jgi:hypothetical protein